MTTDKSRTEWDSFLGHVSHDLRTRLAVVTGAASMLVDDGASIANGTRKELGRILLEESERLDRLVRNMLDVARLESGDLHVRKEWEVVEETVGAAFNRAEPMLGKRELTVRVPPDLLAPYDAALIGRVIANLLEHAAAHAPKGTSIEVNVSRSEREVVFDLAHRGPGFPADEKTRVLEEFRQEVVDQAGPSGTDLAICRTIVALHGGRIWMANRPGGGAAFKFTLPVDGEPPAGQLPELPFAEGRSLA